MTDVVTKLYFDLEKQRTHSANLFAECQSLKREMYGVKAAARALGFWYGTRKHAEDDSYMDWAVFPGRLSDETINNILSMMGWAMLGQICSHEWDCCGCWLTNKPFIRRWGSRKMATQHWARNV